MFRLVTLLAFANLTIALMLVHGVRAQEGFDDNSMTIGAEPLPYADCQLDDCKDNISTTGSGATLSYGCTYTAATGVCTGTCYRCNGSNPSQRKEICVNVTSNIDCQPDGRDASFTCGTGDAKTCNAPGASDGKSCCSTTNTTPPTTGGSCASTTCLKL